MQIDTLDHIITILALIVSASAVWYARGAYRANRRSSVDLATLQRILSLSRVGIFKWLDGDRLWYDQTSAYLTGVERHGEIAYEEWADAVDPEEQARARAAVAPALTEGGAYFDVITYRNGRKVLAVGTSRANGYQMAGINIDVTDLVARYESESAKKAREAEARRAMRAEEKASRLRGLLDTLHKGNVDELLTGLAGSDG